MKSKAAFFSLFVGVSLAFGANSLAQAQNYDVGGMPRCFERGDGLSPVVLSWEKDLYAQKIVAIEVDTARLSAKARAGHTGKPPYPHTNFSGLKKCKNWERAVEKLPLSWGVEVGPKVTGVFGIQFSQDTLQRLEQVRSGGQIARDFNASQFLDRNPSFDYTRHSNIELTGRYGVAFSSQVYRQSLLRQNKNKNFRSQMNQLVQEFKSAPLNMSRIGAQSNVRLLYIKGLGHEHPMATGMHVGLVKLLQSLGIDVEVVATNSFESIAGNAQIIAKKLNETLSQGKNVMLINFSKSAPETLMALSMSQSSRRAKVIAVVSAAGAFEGSFFLDWSTRNPQWILTKHKLKQQFSGNGSMDFKSFQGFKDMRLEKLEEIMKNTFIRKDPLYVNLVGICPGIGLAPAPYLAKYQNDVVRSRMKTGYGANDAYIEYPGTQLTRAGLDQVSVVVEASHAILDGSYNGMALSDPKNLRLFMAALFAQTIENAK